MFTLSQKTSETKTRNHQKVTHPLHFRVKTLQKGGSGGGISLWH